MSTSLSRDKLFGFKLWQFKFAVRASLGEPETTQTKELWSYDLYPREPNGYLAAGYLNSQPNNLASIGVFGIEVTDPKLSVAGIGLGIPRGLLLTTLGEPEYSDAKEGPETLVYNKNLNFILDEGRVAGIRLAIDEAQLSDAGNDKHPYPDFMEALSSGNTQRMLETLRPDVEITTMAGETLRINKGYDEFVQNCPEEFLSILDIVETAAIGYEPKLALRMSAVGQGLVYTFPDGCLLQEIYFLPYNGSYRVYEIHFRRGQP